MRPGLVPFGDGDVLRIKERLRACVAAVRGDSHLSAVGQLLAAVVEDDASVTRSAFFPNAGVVDGRTCHV